MTSLVDAFLAQARDTSNVVIGTTAVTLSGGTVLDGVWSLVDTMSASDDGGLQYDIAASVIVPAAAAVDEQIHGETCMYQGIGLRVKSVQVGTVESTVYFEHNTQALT